MAIIGNLHKLAQQYSDPIKVYVFNYLKTALDESSNIHQRIFSFSPGAFEKVFLDYECFALEQVFYTKERSKCFIESHRKYIDFQLILNGTEQMEYIDISKLQTDTSYDNSKDLITYKMVDNTSKFVLQKGDLAIFFPDDGHVGLPMFEQKMLVYKTVIKLPVEYWTYS